MTYSSVGRREFRRRRGVRQRLRASQRRLKVVVRGDGLVELLLGMRLRVVLIPRLVIPLMVLGLLRLLHLLHLHLLLHLLLHVLRMLHLLQVVHVRGVQTYPVPTRCPRHRMNALSGWIKLRARVDSSRAVPGGPVARHRPRGRGCRGLRPRRSIEVRAAGRVYDRRDRARHIRDQLLGRDDPTRHRVRSLFLLPTSDGRRRSARRR